MSAFEPTSTPRVGSSTISMRGCRTSHFASRTFCWFPPERLRTSRSMLGVAMRSSSLYFWLTARISLREIRPECV